MNFLIIDTSGTKNFLTLIQGKEETVLYLPSKELTKAIHPALNSLNFKKLDFIAICNGPGFFTGVRIGVSVAKALSYSLGFPLIPFHSLELLESLPHQAKILDARGAQCLISVLKRIRIKKPVAKTVGKQLYAQVEYHDDKIAPEQQKKIKAYSFSIIQTIKEMLKTNPVFKEELQIFLSITDFTEGGKLADFAAALTLATREEKQQILESFDIEERIEKSLKLLRNELDINKLQNTITKKIEANVSKAQREFFLREQLKTIKKELGLEKDDYQVAIEKFEERLEGKHVPEDALKVINEELPSFAIDTLELLGDAQAICIAEWMRQN